MRGATGSTLQPHQILRLPRQRSVMIDLHHIWNVIYNAQSNRHQPPTSPNTAPATQNCSPKSLRNVLKTAEVAFPMRDRSETVPTMIREWSDHDPTLKTQNWTRRVAKATFRTRQEQILLKITTFPAPAIIPNFTTCCACHEKWHMNFTTCCACHEKWHMNFTTMLRLPRKVTHELHQMLRLPRKVTRSDTWLLLPTTTTTTTTTTNTTSTTLLLLLNTNYYYYYYCYCYCYSYYYSYYYYYYFLLLLLLLLATATTTATATATTILLLGLLTTRTTTTRTTTTTTWTTTTRYLTTRTTRTYYY